MQHHYIEHGCLKDKYKDYEGRIKAFCKAIADYTGVKIQVDKKGNKTVQFIIIGQGKRVDKALTSIQNEFEVSKVSREPEIQ